MSSLPSQQMIKNAVSNHSVSWHTLQDYIRNKYEITSDKVFAKVYRAFKKEMHYHTKSNKWSNPDGKEKNKRKWDNKYRYGYDKPHRNKTQDNPW